MPTITELHELHLRHLDATLAESELLLQREGGLDGELKTSGSICERYVRDTLRRFIVPGQFRITSGFIATPQLLRDRRNLPQCDVLIVERDTLPLLRFEDSGIEVVPRESVCGIIEVKRTLTARSLADSLRKIQLLLEVLGEAESIKTDTALNKYNRHVGFHNHSSDKPLLAVIALQNQLDPFPNDSLREITGNNSMIDLLWTLDGNALLPAFELAESLLYYSHTARPVSRTWSKLTAHDFQQAESGYYKFFTGRPVWAHLTKSDPSSDRALVFRKVLGVASIMLSRVFARSLQEEQINEYYFR